MSLLDEEDSYNDYFKMQQSEAGRALIGMEEDEGGWSDEEEESEDSDSEKERYGSIVDSAPEVEAMYAARK